MSHFQSMKNELFFFKKWRSLGCRHLVKGKIFKILEFGGLNMITLRIGPFWIDEKKISIFDFFFVKKWLSLGCRHPVEGRIFKILEFGDLNMLTLRIGPFWVDEEKFFRHFFFLPGHAWPCPCLYRAYIEPFICTKA